MNDAPRYATLRDYLRVLREQRLLIVLVTLVFAGAAVGYAARQPKKYVAESSVAFIDENVDAGALGAFLPASQAPDQRAAINAQSVAQPQTFARVQAEVRPRVTLGQLASNTSVGVENSTNNVVIQEKWQNPRLAADVANALAQESRRLAIQASRQRFAKAKRQLQRALADLGNSRSDQLTRNGYQTLITRLDALSRFTSPARVVQLAGVPSSPVSPKPVRDGLLGGLLGLTLGLLAAFIRDSLDRRLRSGNEIREELKLPMLGHVRDDALGRSLVAPNGRKPLTEEDFEAFRILRTNLDFLDVDQQRRTILVTSALPEEGKSTVATSLVCAYALAGKRALLVECDLRRPTLAAKLGIQVSPGLSDYLAGEATPEDVLQTVTLGAAGEEDGAPTVVCIAAGSPTPRPGELLASKRFATFLSEVRAAYDVVVVDSAPLLPVGDTLELVPQMESVVVCVRAQRTTRDQARAARAALDHFPDRPAGVVVTGVRKGDALDYGYYSYAYAYGTRA